MESGIELRSGDSLSTTRPLQKPKTAKSIQAPNLRNKNSSLQGSASKKTWFGLRGFVMVLLRVLGFRLSLLILSFLSLIVANAVQTKAMCAEFIHYWSSFFLAAS